jgi:hypothetical protein
MNNSDNATSAENQQERLIMIGWVVGFVDGEGCFSVGFIKQPNRKNRIGYKLGIQVWCEFAATQGEKSLTSVRKLKNFFGVGSIYLNKRYDNHKEHLYRYVVRRRLDLKEAIIPFFKKYPLQTAKNDDFKKFVRCFEMIYRKEHLTIEGLQKINKIAITMNRRKDRTIDIMRILNDHTRSSNDIGEEMVWTA